MNDEPSIYILAALEQVLSWGLPDDEVADAANAQAHLMAGCCPDDYYYDSNQAEYFSTFHR